MTESSIKKISFKFPFINYMIKNASTNILFKLCKCNKQMKAMIKAAHGLFSDTAYISNDPFYDQTKQIRGYPFSMFYGSLIAKFEFTDANLTQMNPLKVRIKLELYLKKYQKFDVLLPKLNFTELKRILIKQGCMDLAVLKHILNPLISVAGFELTRIEGCNSLEYILLNCPSIESLT
uniref:Uncharacterized protein n=1 Tax=Panagrolaimus superbus TaxID=310955 RepID=A0A914Y3S4_9BILA